MVLYGYNGGRVIITIKPFIASELGGVAVTPDGVEIYDS